MTDWNGNLKFIAPKGTYDVYFYKNEYLPINVQIEISDDNVIQKVELEKKDLVEGELTVETLELDEIIALGIDVTAPENQVLYKYTIEYDDKKSQPFSFTLNAKGEIVDDVKATYEKEFEDENGETV